MVKIVIKKKINLTGYTLIEGFSGVGLVGTISSQYMLNKLSFERIGYIYDESLPPIAVLNKGEILHPIRLYVNKSKKIIIITSELPIGVNLAKKIASELSEWSKKNKLKQIISLEGVASLKGKDPKLFYVSNNKNLSNKVEKLGAIKLIDGFILGVSGELLLECIDDNIPIISLMVESYANLPDGIAAAKLLDMLNKLLGLNINVKPLINEAETFEKQIKNIISQFSKLKQNQNEDKNRDLMYG